MSDFPHLFISEHTTRGVLIPPPFTLTHYIAAAEFQHLTVIYFILLPLFPLIHAKFLCIILNFRGFFFCLFKGGEGIFIRHFSFGDPITLMRQVFYWFMESKSGRVDCLPLPSSPPVTESGTSGGKRSYLSICKSSSLPHTTICKSDIKWGVSASPHTAICTDARRRPPRWRQYKEVVCHIHTHENATRYG